ncbi:MmgE/PrpD family protein, partial [Paracoccus sp. PXZ]
MKADVEQLAPTLAGWIEELRYEDLPAEVVHHVRRCLLDYLGVTIRGAGSRIPRTVQAHLAATEGGGPASVIGTAMKLSPANAAFANGCAASALELDDGHARTAIHLGATCLPSILAMAEARGASSRDIIVAIAAAYEVAARVALGADKASARGFSFTPLVGVFGAVVGAARIMGLGQTSITHALGLAGSNTGGLFDYHGGWLDSWPLNTGRTAREGLLCASWAEAGIAGPSDIFEGPNGFAAGFTDGELDQSSFAGVSGEEWVMLDTYVKPYPCCRRLHSAIDAALVLREQVGAEPESIKRIVVETPASSAGLDRKIWDSIAAAQMSIPFVVAVAFVSGAPNLEHFERAGREDPRVARLAERIDVRASALAQIAESRSGARVTVQLADGMKGMTVMHPSGSPAVPVGDLALTSRF